MEISIEIVYEKSLIATSVQTIESEEEYQKLCDLIILATTEQLKYLKLPTKQGDLFIGREILKRSTILLRKIETK